MILRSHGLTQPQQTPSNDKNNEPAEAHSYFKLFSRNSMPYNFD